MINFRWRNGTLAQRDAEVLCCENGDASELRRLTDLLAHLIWSEAAKLNLEFEDGYDNIVWLNLQTKDLSDQWGEGVNKRLNQIYRLWRAAILQVLRPRYIGKALPLHIERWLGQGRHSLRAVVQAPTHHEQLEAHLQLREWAGQNLSPAKQNQLFDLSN